MTDEQKLVEKLRRIEALFAGATTMGERDAANEAIGRIKRKLEEHVKHDPPVEYKFTMTDIWSKKLFLALLRRYDIRPFRYYRQRRTTVMAKIPASFVDETIWPEFQELNSVLREYLDQVTERIIAQTIFGDFSEAEVIRELPAGND